MYNYFTLLLLSLFFNNLFYVHVNEFLYILFCICITIILHVQGHFSIVSVTDFLKYHISAARPVATLSIMHR